MSYTVPFVIDLGATKTGLAATLRGQLATLAGEAVGDPIASGFVEIGGGSYTLTVTAEDGWTGVLKIYDTGAPAVVLCVGEVSPGLAAVIDGSALATEAQAADIRNAITSLTAYVPSPQRPVLPGQVYAAAAMAETQGIALIGGSATLMRRVTDYAGTRLTRAAVASVEYTIYSLTSGERVPVTGHTAVDVPVAEIIYDTLQTGDPWAADSIGYNFRHTLAIADSQAFAVAGTYLVEFTLTPVTGQPVIVRFRIKVT
jgi:hypothetical protein